MSEPIAVKQTNTDRLVYATYQIRYGMEENNRKLSQIISLLENLVDRKNVVRNMLPNSCHNCKHEDKSHFEEPCHTCGTKDGQYDLWEPADSKIVQDLIAAGRQ